MRTFIYAVLLLSVTRAISTLYQLAVARYPRMRPKEREDDAWSIVFRLAWIAWGVYALFT